MSNPPEQQAQQTLEEALEKMRSETLEMATELTPDEKMQIAANIGRVSNRVKSHCRRFIMDKQKKQRQKEAAVEFSSKTIRYIVEFLQLPNTIIPNLEKAGLFFMGDILCRSREDLLAMRHIGSTTVYRLHAELQKRDLTFNCLSPEEKAKFFAWRQTAEINTEAYEDKKLENCIHEATGMRFSFSRS